METVARIKDHLSRHWPLWLGAAAATAAVATLLAVVFATALYRERAAREEPAGATGAGATKGARPVNFRLVEPINKKALERDVLGRSTREITDMLGAPDDTLWGQTHMAWVYRSSSGANIILVIESGRIVKIDW